MKLASSAYWISASSYEMNSEHGCRALQVRNRREARRHKKAPTDRGFVTCLLAHALWVRVCVCWGFYFLRAAIAFSAVVTRSVPIWLFHLS